MAPTAPAPRPTATELLGRARPAEVEREFRAQIDAVRDAGRGTRCGGADCSPSTTPS